MENMEIHDVWKLFKDNWFVLFTSHLNVQCVTKLFSLKT